MLKETNACVGHFYSGMMPIEEVAARKVFELDHALADAGLANPKRLRGAPEIEMFSHRQGLDHRGQFNLWFTKIPLNVEEASCTREPLRPRVEKRFPQNKIWASPMRSRTKAHA
jgi:hypothetical protein